MTIDKAIAEAIKWLRRFISAAFLVAIAVTAIELLGWNVPGIASIPLTQTAGIGLAGIGFLLSKL